MTRAGIAGALLWAVAGVGCSRAQQPPSQPPPQPPQQPPQQAAAQPVEAPTPIAPTAPVAAPETPVEAPATPVAAGSDASVVGAGPALDRAIPAMDAATAAHVREVFQAGAAGGNNPRVFAKIGDSITESGSFLMDVGHGWYELGAFTRLEPLIRYFRQHHFSQDAEDNSFTRPSAAATAGWTTNDLLENGDRSPLERELRAIHPAFAIVMIGTNDADRGDLPGYTQRLAEIIRRCEAHHVVVMLSTIPDQQSSAPSRALGATINTVIRRAASEGHLPLIDYWAALQPLPNHGLCDDNIHPSCFVQGQDTRSGDFTPAGLRNGYNVRNLTALLMLEQVTRLLNLH